MRRAFFELPCRKGDQPHGQRTVTTHPSTGFRFSIRSTAGSIAIAAKPAEARVRIRYPFS
jgi:hypothetical protein